METQYSLDDLALFVETARHGSLTQMSKTSGVPLSTLSRRLRQLERQLGCRLLDRNAHHFRLTPAGENFLTECGPLLADLHQIGAQLHNDNHQLRGHLSITAPVNLTQHWLGRCINAFMSRHPEIRIELKLSNHYENLVERQFDAAFRVGEPQLPDWIARPIWSSCMGLCASPDYLASMPAVDHLQALHQHRLIMATPLTQWHFRHRQHGTKETLTPRPHLRVDDIGIALNAARAGIGIAYVPAYYYQNDQYQNDQYQNDKCSLPDQPPSSVTTNAFHLPPEEALAPDALKTPSLIPVLPDWRGDERPVYLLYRDREFMPARLRAFVDHVLAWEECQRWQAC
ncbi:MAG: LysR family transcriptional regulator [Hahellaceae bacterium]|nr:LysR family transcriptional regulator [Hahellaceae bacterium]MCP5168262.1 LysR family transcriptional regulator [Hahellaceae bacterium]